MIGEDHVDAGWRNKTDEGNLRGAHHNTNNQKPRTKCEAMATLLVSTLLATATLELTPDTFDKEVFESGKAAFVKFLAPW